MEINEQIDPKVFQKNIELLAEFNPKLAQQIKILPTHNFSLSKTKKGEWNLQQEIEGKTHFVYSPEGAIQEAENWSKEQNIESAEVIYLYGLGLGYYYIPLKKWLNEKKSRRLVFLEDNPEIIYYFAHLSLATEIMQDNQVCLIYFIDVYQSSQLLEKCLWDFYSTKIKCLPSRFYSGTRYADFYLLSFYLYIFQDYVVANNTEFISSIQIYYKNFYRNIFQLPGSYLGNSLFKKFEGIPAIICGAGPSLEKQLPLMKELMNRALIFGGGSSMNILNAAGILPHFGASVDPNPEQYHRLLTNDAFAVPFFYRLRINPEACQLIQGGKLYVCGGYSITDWMDEKLGLPFEQINEGKNVVHFSLELARKMGCNPIILVGMDLAFTEEKTYGKGILSHPLWKEYTNPYEFEETLSVIERKDIYGEKVFTKSLWLIESDDISQYSLRHPELTLLNATEGGIGFWNVANVSLKEAGERYCSQRRDLAGMVHAAIQTAVMPVEITTRKIIALLNTLLASLEKSKNDCRDIAIEITKRSEKINKEKKSSPYILSGKTVLLETEIQEEISYQVVLSNFLDVFLKRQQKSEEMLLKKIQETPSFYLDIEKLNLLKIRFLYLIDVAENNIQFMKNGVQNYIYYSSLEEKSFKPIKSTYLNTNSKFSSPSGVLLSQSQFVDGKTEGKTERYYLSGTLYSRENYKDGVWHGLQEFYYENGQIKTFMEYREGILHGSVRTYHSNGQPSRLLHYQNGVRHGEEKMWTSSGKLCMEAYYENGIPKKRARQWYNSGKIFKEVILSDDSTDFDLTIWDENGKILRTFKQGIEDYSQDYEIMNKKTEQVEKTLKAAIDWIEKEAGKEGAEVDNVLQTSIQELKKDVQNLAELQRQMRNQSEENLREAEKLRKEKERKK